MQYLKQAIMPPAAFSLTSSGSIHCRPSGRTEEGASVQNRQRVFLFLDTHPECTFFKHSRWVGGTTQKSKKKEEKKATGGIGLRFF
jgi:hypothetical protein